MNEHQMIPEHIAQSILARATQIDAHTPAISIDELRAIAAELNVSETSLETALNEYQTLAPPQDTRRRGSLAVAALGLPLGLIGGALLSSATMFTAPSLWLLLTSAGLLSSTGLIVLQSKRPSLNSYVLHNSLLWGGISVGVLSAFAVLGTVTGAYLPWVAVFYGIKHWLTSTILGSAGVTAVLRANAASSGRPDVPLVASGSSESAPAPGPVKRLLNWLKGSLRIPFNVTPSAIPRTSRSEPVPGGAA